MNAFVTILVAILNAVGPSIVQLLQDAFSHPKLDDNGKAALDALSPVLKQDIADLKALKPLPTPHAGSPTIEGEPVPDPKPTRPG